MAEFVQQNIEQMIPEFKEMESSGIFSSKDVRKIMRKRKKFEYTLQRRQKTIGDYTQYIRYETNFLQLIKNRRKALQIHKRTDTESSVVKRIHGLFKQATKRFQHDQKLWLSHINFCKQQKDHIMCSKIYNRMLAVHSHSPELYISAAHYQIEQGAMTDTARVLLMRGIKNNEQSPKLRIEYFRMELLHAEKVRQTSGILPTTDTGEKKNRSIVEEGGAAVIAFKHAVAAIPDFEFCLRFIPVCTKFSFATTVLDHIYTHIAVNFADKAEAESVMCQQPIAKRQQRLAGTDNRDSAQTQAKALKKVERECYEKYEATCNEVNTEAMWNCYLEFCVARLADESVKSVQLHKQRLQQVQEVHKRMMSAGHTAPVGLLLRTIEALQTIQPLSDTIKIYQQTQKAHVTSSQWWKHYFRFLILTDGHQQRTEPETNGEAQQQQAEGDEEQGEEEGSRTLEKLEGLLADAKPNVDTRTYSALLQLTIQYCLLHCDNKHVERLIKSGTTLPGAVGTHYKLQHLDYLMMHAVDVTKARDVYKRLLSVHPVPIQIYNKALDIERMQVHLNLTVIRGIYEDALRQYGATNEDLWISRLQFETVHQSTNHSTKPAQTVGELYWRAKHALHPQHLTAFTEKYTALLHTGAICA